MQAFLMDAGLSLIDQMRLWDAVGDSKLRAVGRQLLRSTFGFGEPEVESGGLVKCPACCELVWQSMADGAGPVCPLVKGASGDSRVVLDSLQRLNRDFEARWQRLGRRCRGAGGRCLIRWKAEMAAAAVGRMRGRDPCDGCARCCAELCDARAGRSGEADVESPLDWFMGCWSSVLADPEQAQVALCVGC